MFSHPGRGHSLLNANNLARIQVASCRHSSNSEASCFQSRRHPQQFSRTLRRRVQSRRHSSNYEASCFQSRRRSRNYLAGIPLFVGAFNLAGIPAIRGVMLSISHAFQQLSRRQRVTQSRRHSSNSEACHINLAGIPAILRLDTDGLVPQVASVTVGWICFLLSEHKD